MCFPARIARGKHHSLSELVEGKNKLAHYLISCCRQAASHSVTHLILQKRKSACQPPLLVSVQKLGSSRRAHRKFKRFMRCLKSWLFRNNLIHCEQSTQAIQKWQAVVALALIHFYLWTWGSKTRVAETLVFVAALQFINNNEILSASVERHLDC